MLIMSCLIFACVRNNRHMEMEVATWKKKKTKTSNLLAIVHVHYPSDTRSGTWIMEAIN